MSYEVRFAGKLRYSDAEAARAAVAAMLEAVSDEDECESFVTEPDLVVVGAELRVDVDGSCPASLWEETLGFLELLGETAVGGRLRCYFEDELTDTIRAGGDKKKAKKRKLPEKADPEALRWAAQFGELDKVEALLAAGTDPSQAATGDSMKSTPLMMACYHGKAKVVERLIAAGADLEVTDYAGDTALFHAASNKNKRGRKRCLELLIEAGANHTHLNHSGQTAVQNARSMRSFDAAKELFALLPRKRTYGGKKSVKR